ncbi:RecX family transcriptional regulator [Candidatus Saccharibacteria bacterium]|nr:RecX family transcriptional regulator [Candidatus Saccharibacteria bacterium]
MEIFTLSDEVPAEKKGKARGRKTPAAASRFLEQEPASSFTENKATASNFAGAPRRITDIRQAVKNENRVNIFINDKYSFSLDIAQVIELKLKIGQTVSEEQLAEYKKASEYGKAYQRALEWVLMRPRSVQELHDYLKRSKYKATMKERQREWRGVREDNSTDKRITHKPRGLEPQYDFSGLICERLIERGYVDDRKFAEYYVENRFVKKGVSRRRLEMELRGKGIEQGIISDVLGARSDTEEIQKIIRKKRGKYDDEKLINYLVRQGFSYQLAQSQVRDYETD